MTLLFTVAEDSPGNVAIHSFFGKNKAEERKFCLSRHKRCHGVYTCLQDAEDKIREIQSKNVRHS